MRALVVIALAVLSAAPKPEALQLDAGAQKVLDVPQGAKVTTSDPSVLEVKSISQTQALLIALQPGSAKLDVGGPAKARTAYAVTVAKRDVAKLTGELRALSGVTKLLVVEHGGSVELTCPGCSEDEREQVSKLSGLFPNVKAIQWVTPPRKAGEVLSGARAILGEAPGQTEGLELDLIDGNVVLRGEVRSADDARRVAAARTAFPELRVALRFVSDAG
ncbi:MAG: pilus assembly protein N-terminal domain-containing protein [Myxococcaceae bacterium]